MRPLQLGNPSVNSSMVAMPTVVALRPVSSEARVGEHSAVVWNCDSRTPRSAIRLMVGISTKPPKQSHVAMPVSSHTRYKTLGASCCAVGAAYGPQSGSESRMSSSILPLNSLAMTASSRVCYRRVFDDRTEPTPAAYRLAEKLTTAALQFFGSTNAAPRRTESTSP